MEPEDSDYGHFYDIEKDYDINALFTHPSSPKKYTKVISRFDSRYNRNNDANSNNVTLIIVTNNDLPSRAISFCLCFVIVYILHELAFIAFFLK